MKRYTVFKSGSSQVQLRDSRHGTCGRVQGIVAVFPTVGGVFMTNQGEKQALRLAKKIAAILNKGTGKGKP